MAIDCVTIGDSIAVGIAAPLSCEIRAAENIPSSRIVDLAPGVWHKWCIVSAGSNDSVNANGWPVHLGDNLQHIRNQSQCQFYIWIDPVAPIPAYVVNQQAKKNHDHSVTFVPATDNIHPKDYKSLAGTIIQITGY